MKGRAPGFRCWRCKQPSGRHHRDLPCRPCEAILLAEYDTKKKANGGKNLYIPEHWDGLSVAVGSEMIEYLCHGKSNHEFSFSHIPGRRRLEDVLPGYKGGSSRPKDRSEVFEEEH